MNLSEHFTLDELLLSQTAERFGIPNVPTAAQIENLRWLCEQVLEPLRNSIGKPIHISSGFRSEAVNAAVGGAPHSDHIQGLAADITAQGLSADELMHAVRRIGRFIPLKTAIREYPPRGWCHVAVLPISTGFHDTPEPDYLVATLEAGETKYGRWTA